MTNLTEGAKAVLLKVGHEPEIVRVNDFHGLQDFVGGFLEGIGGNGWFAYINDDGRSLGLPFNPVATELLHDLGWNRQAFVLGNVVLVGDPDDDGNDTDVQEWVASAAFETARVVNA